MRGHALAIRPIAMTGAGLRLLASGHWAVLASESLAMAECFASGVASQLRMRCRTFRDLVTTRRRYNIHAACRTRAMSQCRWTWECEAPCLTLSRVVARLRRGAFAV